MASEGSSLRGTAVLLDMDGTLVDSQAGIVAGMNATLVARGLPPRDAAALEARIGPPVHDTFAWLLGLPDGDPALDGIVEDYRVRYAALMIEGTRVYDGIPEALQALSGAGCILAVATSKAQHLAEAIVAGLGLSGWFDAVLGPVPPARDGKTETVRQALAAVGGPSRAVMVGDRSHDIEGARAHGLPSVGVLWGFGDEEELVGAGADVVCAEPFDLPEAVAAALTPAA